MDEDISDRDLAAKAVRGDGLAFREFAVEKLPRAIGVAGNVTLVAN